MCGHPATNGLVDMIDILQLVGGYLWSVCNRGVNGLQHMGARDGCGHPATGGWVGMTTLQLVGGKM